MKGERKVNRYIVYAMLAVAALVYANHNVAFGQWPGEDSTPQSNSDSWPDMSQIPALDSSGNYIPPNADKFLCTFDQFNHAHAMNTIDRMEMGVSGKPRCPSRGGNFGSYFSGDQRQALEDLVRAAGVRPDRIIAMERTNFRNAAAVLCEEYDGEIKQLVMWDSQFLGNLDQQAGTRWASVAVMAHELAHHLNNDTGQNPGVIPPHKRRQQELYADRFAGQKLREFGASKREAVAVFHLLGEGGESHPQSRERVAAAGEGWDSGKPSTGNKPRSTSVGGNYPSPNNRQPIASYCQTYIGVCAWNPMAQRVPVGAGCFCPTPYGPVPGIGR